MKPLNTPTIVIFTIFILSLSGFINTIHAQVETSQKTLGDQSPAIKTEGNVSIIYKGLPKEQREILFKQIGNSQKVIDRLLKELNSKDAALAESKIEIEKWVKKYEELKLKVAKLPENDERATKAKAALIEGDLEKARKAVTFSGGSFSGGTM
jgi:chromosome segregation ATPase